MSSSSAVPVFLRDAEIDEEGSLVQIAKTHQDILRFDITVNVIMGVDVFKA
jgi:hypothetical protein